VWGTNDKVRNVKVLEDVLFGFAVFRVTRVWGKSDTWATISP
jgi:hypothetical protein